MINKNPTFEELIGKEDVESWNNEINEGELSLVSALANKQVQLAKELSLLEEGVKAKKEEFRLTSEQELPEAMQSPLLSSIMLIYRRQIKTPRITGLYKTGMRA